MNGQVVASWIAAGAAVVLAAIAVVTLASRPFERIRKENKAAHDKIGERIEGLTTVIGELRQDVGKVIGTVETLRTVVTKGKR